MGRLHTPVLQFDILLQREEAPRPFTEGPRRTERHTLVASRHRALLAPAPAAAAASASHDRNQAWSALAEPQDADGAVGSALPPAALLRRLQLATDPAATRPEIGGNTTGAGVEEAARRAGRSMLVTVCCTRTRSPPPPAADEPPSP